ncbi:hypothetical protein T07_9228 [Trichinella nelsoni]|uniref:Uncharacterized protein n=1 Tax=Trichinella nelsoni TaxID=6336 RepID=A0A0V0SGA9_9BILA|nr:hypothetical protein T07_9228 [Trichinella nelsoni]
MGIRIKIAENFAQHLPEMECQAKHSNLSSKFALIMLHVESFLIKLDAPFTTGIILKLNQKILILQKIYIDI